MHLCITGKKLCLQVRSNDVYRRVDMLSANLKAYVYHRWKAVAKCLEMIALPADGCRKCYSAAAAGHFFTGQQVQEILGLNSTFFEVEVNRPVPNSIEIPIENPYGIEIGRKEVPIKVSERSISFKDILKDLHFVSGEKGEMVTFKGRGQGSGLGLSQWGARGMANSAPPRSRDYYKEILTHYYTDTRVEKIY